jgi:hypothetical protein
MPCTCYHCRHARHVMAQCANAQLSLSSRQACSRPVPEVFRSPRLVASKCRRRPLCPHPTLPLVHARLVPWSPLVAGPVPGADRSALSRLSCIWPSIPLLSFAGAHKRRGEVGEYRSFHPVPCPAARARRARGQSTNPSPQNTVARLLMIGKAHEWPHTITITTPLYPYSVCCIRIVRACSVVLVHDSIPMAQRSPRPPCVPCLLVGVVVPQPMRIRIWKGEWKSGCRQSWCPPWPTNAADNSSEIPVPVVIIEGK